LKKIMPGLKEMRSYRSPLVRGGALWMLPAVLHLAACGYIAGVKKKDLPAVDASDTADDGGTPDPVVDPVDAGEDPVQDRVEDEGPTGPCTIAGLDYMEGEENPGNECEACLPSVSALDWSPKPDMAECTGGLCCGGQCREGAECCAEASCPGWCGGDAAPCGASTTQAACDAQTGCSWVSYSGACEGTYACADVDPDPTQNCVDCACDQTCAYGTCFCDGTPRKECGEYASEQTCVKCGCDYVSTSGECTGLHQPCAVQIDEPSCGVQAGCSWARETCVGYRCGG
jgi:hypothetical protein